MLFDMELRAFRRDRAARTGPELFLLERAFADCLERLALVQRRFARALLIGCPDPGWSARLREFVDQVEVRDPGPHFAEAAGGEAIIEDNWVPAPDVYDLVVAIGTLDTVNDLPLALKIIFQSMQPGSLLLGAISGGDTVPQLRSAMRAADAVTGLASAHVHPRIEASAVAPLLSHAGFAMPVVDVDRAMVSYPSLDRLVADLRRMGATNILDARSRHNLSKTALAAARERFAAAGDGKRVIETFEVLHFAAWTLARIPSSLEG
ncbi:MAG TPA: methyltransferase domain-containing protein [Sphingomicrobium sp.]|nr:methyltransferase domain-containing protein [Sphingomicrobium sp.]